jgi:DMSO/TMAO reductase YedYZ molybdopterin-dependent catalytic subunit
LGNVRFAGVPLAAVLEKYKIKIDPEVRFLTAKGKDQPQKAGQEEFEHSLPLDEALKKTFLAFKLNGEPLPAVHGGPVRLITPGYFATMNVKWLASLRFDKSETTNHYQLPQYRTPRQLLQPGQKFEFTLTNSNPTWRMRVTSFILSFETGAKLEAGTVTFRGVAFNDGEARLEAVLVSLDRGRTWEQAALSAPTSPYAWYPWTFKAALKPGTHPVWSRAIDTLGRSQPLDGNIHWNPNGYAWHGVDKIEVAIRGEGA